jgi:hypothetical protein
LQVTCVFRLREWLSQAGFPCWIGKIPCYPSSNSLFHSAGNFPVRCCSSVIYSLLRAARSIESLGLPCKIGNTGKETGSLKTASTTILFALQVLHSPCAPRCRPKPAHGGNPPSYRRACGRRLLDTGTVGAETHIILKASSARVQATMHIRRACQPPGQWRCAFQPRAWRRSAPDADD